MPEPFDLIVLVVGLYSAFMITLSLERHEAKVKNSLKETGFNTRDEIKRARREIIQNISDPNISLLGRSWIIAIAALFFIAWMSILLRTSLINGIIIVLISIILASLLIAWLFGLRIPVLGKELKHPEVPLKRCYHECGITKRNYYKNLYEVSFAMAIFSILFAFGGYVIPYYHGLFSILGVHILGLHLHSFASVLFAICLVLLVSPMLRLSGWGRLFFIYVKRLVRRRKQKIF